MDSTQWFTEEWAEQGSAISLKTSKLLHTEQTPYQRVDIWETETFGTLMTLDGLVMVTSRDNFIYHEMLSHPALYAHENPRSVLVIGGGDCGTLREVLRHKTVQSAVQVELDERVTRVAEVYFPELCVSNRDPRAEFHFLDGIQWVKDAPDECYDVILIDSTDPVGPAEGLFTSEFYRQCHRALRVGGILAGQTESPLFHVPILQNVHRSLKTAGFTAAKTLQFPQCTYPSGWWSVTMAQKGGDLRLVRSENPLHWDHMETKYYTPEVHRAAMVLPRYVAQALSE